jgi:coenzyme F420-0:L-glutamate ligase/coenzyme F420-1:gamma-L-glutamate ligase
MNSLQIIPLENIEDVTSKTNLAHSISNTLQKQAIVLEENDILVITQKVVSKAEGRIINLQEIKPSDFAKKIALQNKKDPAHIEVILRESKRIVRMDHAVIISETHHGFICANAGVDESNVGNNKTVTLLPIDPDASAKKIYDELSRLTKIKKLGIIISDTWGRPWREGQVNFAIGVYGISPLIDYRGKKDSYGHKLKASLIAIADEIASAAELVFGKTNKVPVAVIRGYKLKHTDGNGKTLLRNPAIDMFR